MKRRARPDRDDRLRARAAEHMTIEAEGNRRVAGNGNIVAGKCDVGIQVVAARRKLAGRLAVRGIDETRRQLCPAGVIGMGSICLCRRRLKRQEENSQRRAHRKGKHRQREYNFLNG